MQDRAKALQELYLRATRMCEGSSIAPPSDSQRLELVEDIIHSAMPQRSTSGFIRDSDLEEPSHIVPALQQIAALRRDRDVLRTQVNLSRMVSPHNLSFGISTLSALSSALEQ